MTWFLVWSRRRYSIHRTEKCAKSYGGMARGYEDIEGTPAQLKLYHFCKRCTTVDDRREAEQLSGLGATHG